MYSYHIIGYLIIFLPLASCFLCFLTKNSKSSFFIFLITNFLILISSLYLVFLLPNFYTKLVSNLQDSALSIAINYNFSFLGLSFVALVSFITITTSIFYKNILNYNYSDQSKKLFYSLNSLNLFSIIGIFSTDNIINLYIYIELYSISFYAISSASKENSLIRLSFKYYYQGVIGSLLILISVFFLFINFDNTNFDQINLHISSLKDDYDIFTISCIFFMFLSGLILKFFPFWIYFQNIKSSKFLSSFLSSKLLLIKVIIGIYLSLQSLFFIFGENLIFSILMFDRIILILGFVLIFYSNVKILKNNNLKVINSYYCLIFLSFIFISIAIGSPKSIIASIFFIAHYSIVGLAFLLICAYMRFNYYNCNIKNLSLLKNDKFLIKNYFKILIILICGFPASFLFFANWYLALSIFDNENITIILLPVIITNFTFANLAIKMTSYFYRDSNILKLKFSNNLKDNIYYLISISCVFLLLLFLTLNIKFTSSFFKNLSLYLTNLR